MSCPDWKSLVSAREAGGEDPPGWRRSLEHLAGCEGCRREALEADPTLIFQRLPEARVGTGEVVAMRDAVSTLVRARRLATSVPAAPPARPSSPGRWLRPAAAAALLAAALTLGPAVPPPPSAREAAAAFPELAAAPRGSAAPTHALVEELDLPDARVYQLAREDLSVVMIVDPSLDL